MTAPAAAPGPRRLQAIFRTQLWWSPKVLPVLGTALLAALLADAEPGPGLTRCAALLVSAAGIAAGSHLVNDWADIGADAAAGKANLAAALAPPLRIGLLVLALAVGLGPWMLVPIDGAARGLLAALCLLPIAYSVPPIRLKGRSLAGVLADAADAHVIPTLLTFLVVADAGTRGGAWRLGLLAAGGWSTGVGVRAILHHQMIDLPNDQAAGVWTFVSSEGRGTAQRLGTAAFVVEAAGLGGLIVALASVRPLVLAPFAAYALLWTAQQRWSPRRFEPVPSPGNEWTPLVEFYQVWPAVLFAVALVIDDRRWWPIPLLIVLAFGGAVAKQGADLVHLLATVGHDLHVALRLQATRALWWARLLPYRFRKGPFRWFRFRVYWPFRHRLAAIGHFRRRQVRRIRRHWRTWRARRGAAP